jgi:DNA recombination protein RmuC
MPVTEILLSALIIAVVPVLVLQALSLLRGEGHQVQRDTESARIEAEEQLRELSSQLARAQAQAERTPVLENELSSARAEVSTTRAELAGKSSQLDAAAANLATAEQHIATLTSANRELLEKRGELLESNARLEQEIKSAKQREQETTTLLAGAKEEMAKEFKLVAATLLEEKGAKLTEQQRNTLSTLLDPFSETLKDFKRKVEAARETDVKDRAGLIAQILELTKLNQDIGAKAQSLTNALRGESKTRGMWGEAVLQRILELAGLREGAEFRTQASHHSDEVDGRLIPDVVLDLPHDRAIVIDAKVSLVAYERFVSTNDDEQARRMALDDHSASIKRHINDLSKKNYPSLYNLKTVDFTLLFVPIESALISASEADPGLAQYALERHIALVSPNTLFTVLRTIEYIWRVDKTTRSLEEIVKRGGLMYDAAVRFGEYMVAINDALAKATLATQAAERALVNPRNGLMRQAERLRELGIKPKRDMPERLSSAGTGEEPANGLPPAELRDARLVGDDELGSEAPPSASLPPR